jgi:pimeloyl-ACP methyl ester carboxylesterase
MMTDTFAKPNGERSQPLTPPAIDRLREISVPTLVIVGDKDVNSILEISDLLANGIQGAQKVVMPNTAHLPNMEKPAEFNQIVLEFLEKI